MPRWSSRPRLLIIALLAVPHPGRAQNPSLTDSIHTLSRRGAEVAAQGTRADLLQALPLFHEALRLSRVLHDPGRSGDALFGIGYTYLRLSEPDSALTYLKDALQFNRAASDTAGEARTLDHLAQLHYVLGEPARAAEELRAALSMRHALQDLKGIGESAINLGVVLSTLGFPDSSLRYYQVAVKALRQSGDRIQEGNVLGNIGQFFWRYGDSDSAFFYAEQALAIAREVKDRSGQATTLANLGSWYGELGEYSRAQVLVAEALEVFQAIGERDGEAYALANLGHLFDVRGQLDSALAYAERALAIREAMGDASRTAGSLRGLASLQLTLGRADSAVALLRRATGILEAAGDRPGQADADLDLAATLRALKQLEPAKEYSDRGLAVFRELGDTYGVALGLHGAGVIRLELGQADSALTFLQEALVLRRQLGDEAGAAKTMHVIGRALATRPGGVDSALVYVGAALADERRLGDQWAESRGLFRLAVIHHRARQPARLGDAIAYYDSASRVRSQLRRSAGSDLNSLSFAEQDLELFEGWTLAWAARAEQVGDPGRVAALAAAEAGRAQTLLDLIHRSTSDSTETLPLDLAGQLNALTRSGAAVLSYFSGTDTLLIWLARNGAPVEMVRRAIGRDSLGTMIAAWRQGMGADGAAERSRAGLEMEPGRGLGLGGTAGRSALGPQLSELVLPPALLRIAVEELIIIPHGPLALLPFAALPVGDQEYLGSRHPIRYGPSLAILMLVENPQARTGNEGGSLVIGDPEMPVVSNARGSPVKLPALSGARAEASAVAVVLGGKVITGPGASESMVRQQLPSARVVHLATHGFAYSAETLTRSSFIALAADSANDGLLTVGEVLDDVTVGADLVVLSACQTGLGNLKNAEGTVGLQRAFLAKGARSVLVSLWSVDDRATRLLMERFYAHWLNDRNAPGKAEALRRAQEDVRKTTGFEHPRFWAAFQMVGAK